MTIGKLRLCGWWMLVCLVAVLVSVRPGRAADAAVSIHTDFPGGNVRVQQIDGTTVYLAPDLRGDTPWFYWYFAAEAAKPGRVTFRLVGAPLLGSRGPAVSLDGGATWSWLGVDHVQYDAPRDPKQPNLRDDIFTYEFTAARRPVRFAVGIPYLQQNLQAFTQAHAGNPHLTTSVLTKSRQERPVPLLRIGTPGPGVRAVLVTARHHACEAMASYVLEGFLQEALSASPAGEAFRKQYVLYAVPIVDVDGVEAGDQGKGRKPHDHNRDYGKTNLYPEIQAIQQLADRVQVQFALDFHCPTLRREVDGIFYFDGLNQPQNRQQVDTLSRWMEEEGLRAVTSAPRNWMKQPPATPPTENLPFSHYFGYRKSMVLAATLECPYTMPDCPLDAAMARAYGASLLRAWNRMAFTAPQEDAGLARLRTLRERFQQVYARTPEQAEALTAEYLNDAAAPALYRAEAQNLMGQLRFRQRRYADALAYYQPAAANAGATTGQRATAITQCALVTCADPASTPDAVASALTAFAAFPYPAPAQQAQVCAAASTWYEKQGDLARALTYAQQGLPVATKYDQGKVMNRIAALHDALRQPEEAIALRRRAVEVLRAQLQPMPPGIFGSVMAADLFDALCGIPTATREEKVAAAQMVFDHPVSPVGLKERIRAALAALEQK